MIKKENMEENTKFKKIGGHCKKDNATLGK